MFKQYNIVHIEFKRIQTYLFSASKLLNIIGANALLGETIRYKLCCLAIECESTIDKNDLPDQIPKSSESDPLKKLAKKSSPQGTTQVPVGDTPKQLYSQGILSRDGGHFEASFKNDSDGANTFISQAVTLLREELPGLSFNIMLDGDPTTSHSTQPSRELPFLQTCQQIGHGLAETIIKEKDTVYLSSQAKKTLSKGKIFRNANEQQPWDMASLLTQKLLKKYQGLDTPIKLTDLCASNHYLAIIAADGNSIGEWSKEISASQSPKPDCNEQDISDKERFAQQAKKEAFYLWMRASTRQALETAIKETFPKTNDEMKIEFKILMLGGDDLVLACKADYALKFCEAFAKAIAKVTPFDSESERKLTYGMGVAIAKPKFPFHRLVGAAENLCSSAKQLARATPSAKAASTVDWAICNESWMNTPDKARSHLVKHFTYECTDSKSPKKQQETLILSAKPYFILNKESAPEGRTLSTLLTSADTITKSNPSNNQLHRLNDLIHKGRGTSDLQRELMPIHSAPTAEALSKTPWKQSLWQPVNTEVINDTDSSTHITTFGDLMEVMDIPKLRTGENEGESND